MTDGPAAGWYPDPLGRFDHRYWDGTAWTHHASRAGQATVDPLPGTPSPTRTVQAGQPSSTTEESSPSASPTSPTSPTTDAGGDEPGATGPATEQTTRLPEVTEPSAASQPDGGFAAVGSSPAQEPAWPTSSSGTPGATTPGGYATGAPGGGGVPPTGGTPPYTGGPGAGGWTQPGPSKTTNVKAVISLILSLIWLGGLGSLVGIVLGVMARKDIKRSGGREGGDGVAIAGIVIGALGILATILGAIAIAGFVNAVESGEFGATFEESFAEGFEGEVDFGGGAEGSLEYTLLDVDFYQDLHKDETGVYAASAQQLEDLGWLTSDDVSVRVVSQGGEYWCVEGRSDSDPSVVWFTDSNDADGPGPGTC